MSYRLLTEIEVRQVACPKCGAAKGAPCDNPRRPKSNHMERVKAARAATKRVKR